MHDYAAVKKDDRFGTIGSRDSKMPIKIVWKEGKPMIVILLLFFTKSGQYFKGNCCVEKNCEELTNTRVAFVYIENAFGDIEHNGSELSRTKRKQP